ncbi:FadR/GntR family transcriptional regulator [Arvimicrobium flavum]|uniref:FadR/GntR family transcriptional regulator n=1 Tax=Arvimicrobium flavum TaxID=3393320 RepID=UPI00237A74E7|nr:FadR/GntR family transcriptional regulator [Mesorhizobium shangrilense]
MKLSTVPPRSSLVDDAIRLIETSIREGTAAGTRLPSEAEISRQLGVSRPVVREALAFLRADGLVESRHGQGLFVTEQAVLRIRADDLRPDRAGLLDLLEMRRALESETARLAAQRRTPEDVDKLRAALEGMAAAEREGRDGVREDLHFHLTIASIGRNPLLMKIIHFWTPALQDAIGYLREADKKDAEILRTRQHRHEEIFGFIEAGNADAAHKAMVDHMNETLDRFEKEGAPEKS